tara:strand:+ start:302 stop:403 length:102 start_codon:yes stop_codon:yes gene_type:complete
MKKQLREIWKETIKRHQLKWRKKGLAFFEGHLH